MTKRGSSVERPYLDLREMSGSWRLLMKRPRISPGPDTAMKRAGPAHFRLKPPRIQAEVGTSQEPLFPPTFPC